MRLKAKSWVGLLAVVLLVAVMTGCGGPKADLTIFMSHEFTLPEDSVTALQDEINDKLNGEYIVKINASPLYNMQKIMIEYAAAGNGLMVLPKDDIKKYSENGGNLALDEYLDPATYEEGVFEGLSVTKTSDDKFEEKNGKYLFGLPTDKLPLMEKHGLVDNQWYVAVPSTTPNIELSVKVLKLLMEQE